MLHATAHWKATIHIYSLKKFHKKSTKFIACIVASQGCKNPFWLTMFFRG
jgi:hypothetical protein